MVLTSSSQVIRRWPTPRSREWLESFLSRATDDPNVLAIVAIGSAVRSDVASEDLDIIVICRDRSRLRERAPIEVDLRSFDIEQLERGLSKGDDLLTWSVRFGRALFDREGTWDDVVAAWRHRLPLPDPSVARDRAAVARGRLEEMNRIGDENAIVDLSVSYLTHLARALLSEAQVYPASRPELAQQLQQIGQHELAEELTMALEARARRHGPDSAGK